MSERRKTTARCCAFTLAQASGVLVIVGVLTASRRLAATVQIAVVPAALIFVDNTFLKSIYVILLALFNDISMTPIASDNARPSLKPDVPTLSSLLIMSFWLGGILTAQTLLFYYTASDKYIGIPEDKWRCDEDDLTLPRKWRSDSQMRACIPA